MKYIVHISDIHLGLTTNEIDRTDEIVKVTKQAVKKAIKIKKKGKDVIMVFGGDIFNHNNPSEYLISKFIGILNPLKKYKVKTFITVGNHDSISDPDRKSCLDFVDKIKIGYPNIRLIDDIEKMRWFQSDLGEVYLTFLPHITKAHLKGTKYKKVQKYIDKKAKRIKKEIGQGQHNYVFSHLNVKGIIPGSEENLLKKSEVWLPDCFVMDSEEVGFLPPIIIQAHIHTRQKINNIRVGGSPMFCDFGEKEKNKYFMVIHVPETFGEKGKIKYVETKCKKFIEFDWDITSQEMDDYDNLFDVVPKLNKNVVLKVNAVQTIHQNIDWEGIRKELAKKCYYVKPIQPKIIKDRLKRNKKQIINLNPKDAVKVWLKKNKPKNKKTIKELAYNYIDNLVKDNRVIKSSGKQLKIYSLQLINFMPYKKCKKVFNKKDIIGILCNYKGNKKRSNRGGKTALIEAIKYAAFGLSRASNETALIHRGKELMKVILILIDEDGIKYKITRGRDINNKGILECGWVDKKREAQKAINDLIGSDKTDFELTSFFDQDDINGFMDKSPTEKKKFMMCWLQNLHWIELLKTVADDLKEANEILKEARIKRETLADDLESKSAIKEDIKTAKNRVEKLKKKKLKLDNKHDKLKSTNSLSRKDIKILKVEKWQLDESIDDLTVEWDELIKLRGVSVEAKKELKKQERKFENVTVEGLKKKAKKYLKKITNTNRDIRELQNMVDAAKEDFTGICPILKEKCDRIFYNKKTILKWRKRIDALHDKMDQLKVKEGTVNGKLEDIELVKELKISLKNDALQLKGMKSLEKSLKQQKSRYRALKKQLSAGVNTKIDKKISKLNDTIYQLSLKISDANKQVGALESTLKNIIKTRKKIKVLRLKESELQQDVVILKYITLMFGKNGIPSQEIENAFDEIEDDINFILDRMQCGLEVSFSSDREINKWEESCVACDWRFPKGTRLRECESCGEKRKKKRRDELSLKVLENGSESDFEMDSKGGKVLISTAVRIALTRLKQRQTGSNFMVLFMDEPDASLDEYNSERFMGLITNILTKSFGYKQIFWLSHNKDIQGSIPHLLMVDRYKTHSKVRWI